MKGDQLLTENIQPVIAFPSSRFHPDMPAETGNFLSDSRHILLFHAAPNSYFLFNCAAMLTAAPTI